jgi:hypothetical protein
MGDLWNVSYIAPKLIPKVPAGTTDVEFKVKATDPFKIVSR